MKTSEEIYPEERRKEVYKKYSPELDKCIDALRLAELVIKTLKDEK